MVGTFFRIYSAYYYLRCHSFRNIFRRSPLTMNLNVKSAASLSHPIHLCNIVSLTFVNSTLFVRSLRPDCTLFFRFVRYQEERARRTRCWLPGIHDASSDRVHVRGTLTRWITLFIYIFVKLQFSFHLNVDS